MYGIYALGFIRLYVGFHHRPTPLTVAAGGLDFLILKSNDRFLLTSSVALCILQASKEITHMATRIYQGRILSAKFENPEENHSKHSALDTLVNTFELFQDAVNYHLVALAGMISPSAPAESTLGKFRKQVEDIWRRSPRDKAHARTLQQSVTKTLSLPRTASFEEALGEIYKGTAEPELLPYVLQLIIERLGSGEKVIQQEGRSALPKLCDPRFSGNFDYSPKEKKAAAGKLRLQQELSKKDITQEELTALAAEMDLSWGGIKTQPNSDHTDSEKFNQAESYEKIIATMNELCLTLSQQSDPAWRNYEQREKKSLHAEVVKVLQNSHLSVGEHLLAKNKKTPPELKQAAVFFKYYPCKISAELLLIKLGKEKKQKETKRPYDCSSLQNDPILLCRGQRGYIYKGFTALPEWESSNDEMYSTEWDILAFKEALKTLHSFELKTEERNRYVSELEKDIHYMESGEGSPSGANEEEDSQLPVLGGDPRFELLKDLLREIAPENYDHYTISRRALKGFDEILESWKKELRNNTCTENTLRDIVRSTQSSAESFGAGVLFEALCQKKYQPIWQEWADAGNASLTRSKNILKDFSRYQALKQEKAQYEEIVQITAAEANASPRQLLFSDLNNFGSGRKGYEFVKGQDGVVKLPVITRNPKGRLQGTTIVVQYSAPRFIRDDLGIDPAGWLPQKKSAAIQTSWLQPMMKALNLNTDRLHMTKEPALGLQVKRCSHSNQSQTICLLNFPISLDFDDIHRQIGKAALWNSQMLGGADEKLHLHWPATHKGNKSPWWESAQVKKEGFRVLGIDLGVRYAAAWALIDVQLTNEIRTAKGSPLSGREIGCSGTDKWYGFCTKSGLIKLDGEGILQPRNSDRVQAPDGIAPPSQKDIELAKSLLSAVGKNLKQYTSVLNLCNDATRAFKVLLFRCRKYQSILVDLKDENKQNRALEEANDYFNSNEATQQLIPNILRELQQKNIARIQEKLRTALLELRNRLPEAAEKLTNLLLPRKHGEWVWQHESTPGYIGVGKMVPTGFDTPQRKIYHRGGLSIQRLTQIENLRKMLQSMNRILHETPGIRADFGSKLKDIRVVDPCPDILRKIENIREQRVNKIAHEITAMALGLQLKAPRKDKNADNRDIIHGEYMAIPDRRPVDFVVLENLSRYRTSIDRTPAENSTLMRWAHRQIVAKVKQLLEEVFGIPVLCTHAAYTSKFDALTSAPGFRAVEMTEWRLEAMRKKINSSNHERQLVDLYSNLLKIDGIKRDGLKLLMPGNSNSGEFFLSNTPEGVRMRNADINAAINIAWRGIAAPEALHLLHRLRLNRKKGQVVPLYANQREKALKKNWTFTPIHEMPADSDFTSAFWQNEKSPISPDAQYGATGDGTPASFLHGKKLWGTIKSQRWKLCHQFNIRVLKKISARVCALEKYLSTQSLLPEDDTDIPL